MINFFKKFFNKKESKISVSDSFSKIKDIQQKLEQRKSEINQSKNDIKIIEFKLNQAIENSDDVLAKELIVRLEQEQKELKEKMEYFDSASISLNNTLTSLKSIHDLNKSYNTEKENTKIDLELAKIGNYSEGFSLENKEELDRLKTQAVKEKAKFSITKEINNYDNQFTEDTIELKLQELKNAKKV